MRTVKKYGGLDKYVLGVRNKWLGERAMWLRTRLQDEIRKRESTEASTSSGEGESSGATLTVRPKTELEKRSDRLLLSVPVCSSHASVMRTISKHYSEARKEQRQHL